MAEKPAAERTEEATPERLRKARREGQIPQCKEVPSALTIAALLIALALSAPALLEWFASQARQGLSVRTCSSLDVASFSGLLHTKVAESLFAIMPILLALAAASVFASLLAAGWALSPKAVSPKLERISPVKGLKNLLSGRSLVHLTVSIAKLLVMLAIVYHYLQGKWETCLALRWATPGGIVVAIARLVFGLMVRAVIGLLVIALIDLIYQRWHYKRQLRMTRQEVKEERKQHEVSPEVRGRIRAVQIEMVRKRMLQEVPTADVVLTNPNHVAVALRYDTETMEAPQVVAKGPDLLAEKIKEIARTHGVPIVHRPELARTLYSAAEVGQAIPEALFVAVAEVLAMIYRLRSKRRKVLKDRE